jgi:8-oxo-dGTP pyrophosphatase MutT (NUDIX family)
MCVICAHHHFFCNRLLHKERAYCVKESLKNKKHMNKEVSAGIVVYRRTKDGIRYLLLYHGGRYWNFPKGHIEPVDAEGDPAQREKSLEAALRETEEETGLQQKDLRIDASFRVIEQYSFVKRGKQVSKKVIFFLAEANKRAVTISHEHEGFGWFRYKDAHALLEHYKDSEEILRKARWFIARMNRTNKNEKK